MVTEAWDEACAHIDRLIRAPMDSIASALIGTFDSILSLTDQKSFDLSQEQNNTITTE